MENTINKRFHQFFADLNANDRTLLAMKLDPSSPHGAIAKWDAQLEKPEDAAYNAQVAKALQDAGLADKGLSCTKAFEGKTIQQQVVKAAANVVANNTLNHVPSTSTASSTTTTATVSTPVNVVVPPSTAASTSTATTTNTTTVSTPVNVSTATSIPPAPPQPPAKAQAAANNVVATLPAAPAKAQAAASETSGATTWGKRGKKPVEGVISEKGNTGGVTTSPSSNPSDVNNTLVNALINQAGTQAVMSGYLTRPRVNKS